MLAIYSSWLFYPFHPSLFLRSCWSTVNMEVTPLILRSYYEFELDIHSIMVTRTTRSSDKYGDCTLFFDFCERFGLFGNDPMEDRHQALPTGSLDAITQQHADMWYLTYRSFGDTVLHLDISADRQTFVRAWLDWYRVNFPQENESFTCIYFSWTSAVRDNAP